jgi:uncharacterized membrane protein
MKTISTDQYTSNVTQDDASLLEDNTSAVESFGIPRRYLHNSSKLYFYEKLAAFCSSWKFILLMSVILGAWILLSTILWFRT